MRNDRLITLSFAYLLSLSLVCLSGALQAAAAAEPLDKLVETLESTPNYPINNELVERIKSELDANPGSVYAHVALGMCYERLGMPDFAKEQFSQAAKFGPNDPAAILGLIRAEINFGRFQSAVTLLESAYKRFPDNPQLMYWHADYLAHLGDKVHAAELFNKAAAKQPNILGLSSAMAQLRFEQGDYGKALFLANKDLALDPDFWAANLVKGSALSMLGRQAEALKPLRIAYRQGQYKPGIANRYAYSCYWEGEYRTAIDPALISLCLAAKLSTDTPQEKMLLTKIIRKLPPKVVAERVSSVSHAMDKMYRSAAFHFALGDVLDRVGLKETAIEQYQAGLAIAPNFARGVFRLGKDLEMARHEYPEALICYSKAHSLDPEDAEIDRYFVRLGGRQRKSDLAWNLRDWLNGFNQKREDGD